MALPSAPASISLNQVNVELGLSGTASISLNDAAVRALFGVPSGQISMSQGYGKSNFYHSSKTKGYMLGGDPGGNAFYRVTFSTDAVASVGSMPVTLYSLGGEYGNADKSFLAGGYKGGWSSTTEKITYSTDVMTAAPAASLSSGRGSGGSWGNSDKGFHCGGFPGQTTSDKITNSTETKSAIAALPVSSTLGRAVGNNDYNFIVRGQSTTISKLTHSTETHSAVPISPTQPFYYVGRLGGDSDKGYVGGGAANGSGVNWDRITFPTTVVASVPAVGQSRSRYGCSFNSTQGYHFAGFIGASTRTPTIAKATYSTETAANIPTTAVPNIEGSGSV